MSRDDTTDGTDEESGEGRIRRFSTFNTPVSRRDVMRSAGAVSAAAGFGGLAGCTQSSTDATATDTDGGGGSGNGNGSSDSQIPEYQLIELRAPPTELQYDQRWPERDITMVTHDASTSFFDPTQAGLHDAAEQLGWNANFTGPSSGFDVQEQVSILESTVSSQPDVIATTIAEANAYNDVIQSALDNDIYVVLYNTNALSREQMRENFGQTMAYTGQGQVGAGYACGLAFLERLPDDAGLVSIGTCCPGHSALEARTQGIEIAIEQNSDLEMTDRVNYTDDSSEGVSRLQDHIAANPELDGIVGTDAFTWFIGEAITNEDMAGDIVGGGFDLVTDTLEHIQDGTMQFTIGQDPYSQGYIPVKQAWEYLERGMSAKNYDTAAEVIDSNNVEFAMQRSDWGTLREWQNSDY